MKKIRGLTSLILCSIIILSALPVSAAIDASKQISNYNINAWMDGDDIIIDFHVTGANVMDELGAESIKVYRKVGNHWVFEAEQRRAASGMTECDSMYHDNTYVYPADGSLEYKVVVTIFAENSDGYDSRTKTIYI